MHQWGHTFKFNGVMHQSLMDLSLRFQPDAPYTHVVEKGGDQ